MEAFMRKLFSKKNLFNCGRLKKKEKKMQVLPEYLILEFMCQHFVMGHFVALLDLEMHQ